MLTAQAEFFYALFFCHGATFRSNSMPGTANAAQSMKKPN